MTICDKCGDDPQVVPNHSVQCQNCGKPVRCEQSYHPDPYPSNWFTCYECYAQWLRERQ